MIDPAVRAAVLNLQGDGAGLSDELRSAAIEQYRIYVELTDQLSHRRVLASSYFVTITSAAVAALGYIHFDQPEDERRAYLVVSAVGMMLSLVWGRMIRSYRDLNRTRFAVIYAMESILPLKPYTAEWATVQDGSPSKRYKPVTYIEGYVPWLLFFVFAGVFAYNVYMAFQ